MKSLLKGKSSFFGSFKKWVKIKSSLRVAWRLLQDKRMPRKNKYIFLGLSLVYLILPTDILPDFILLFGWLDDLAILTLLIKLFNLSAPLELRRNYLPEAQSRKENYKHKQDR